MLNCSNLLQCGTAVKEQENNEKYSHENSFHSLCVYWEHAVLHREVDIVMPMKKTCPSCSVHCTSIYLAGHTQSIETKRTERWSRVFDTRNLLSQFFRKFWTITSECTGWCKSIDQKSERILWNNVSSLGHFAREQIIWTAKQMVANESNLQISLIFPLNSFTLMLKMALGAICIETFRSMALLCCVLSETINLCESSVRRNVRRATLHLCTANEEVWKCACMWIISRVGYNIETPSTWGCACVPSQFCCFLQGSLVCHLEVVCRQVSLVCVRETRSKVWFSVLQQCEYPTCGKSQALRDITSIFSLLSRDLQQLPSATHYICHKLWTWNLCSKEIRCWISIQSVFFLSRE